uniref:RIIa domain-containing protein n=1 Tax=Macrostomum lignano TaxID=282301 RepID=A0A1I8FMQ6_9PLAT
NAANTEPLRFAPAQTCCGLPIRAFLRSRPRRAVGAFTDALARTQAVEYLAEWCQTPDNLAYERISSGLRDPAAVGDKANLFLGAEFRPVWPEAVSPQELVTMATGANLPSSNNSVAPAALGPAEFAAAFSPAEIFDQTGDRRPETTNRRTAGAAAAAAAAAGRRSSSELSEDAEDDELDEGLGDCRPEPTELRCSDAFSRSGSVRYSSTSDLSNLRSQTRYSHDDSSLGVGGRGSGGRRGGGGGGGAAARLLSASAIALKGGRERDLAKCWREPDHIYSD